MTNNTSTQSNNLTRSCRDFTFDGRTYVCLPEDVRGHLWTDEEGQQWRVDWCDGCGQELAAYPND